MLGTLHTPADHGTGMKPNEPSPGPGLFPRPQLASPCFEAAWSYRPVETVGGDLLVAETLPGGRQLFILMADVMGHGLAAALVACGLRGALVACRQAGTLAPGPLLGALNRALPPLGPGFFATAFACLLDGADGTATFSSAGHPPVLLRDAGGVRGLSTPSLPLGISADHPYEQRVVPLHPGATLLAYTDGISESLPVRRGPAPHQLGQLLSLAGPDPERILDALDQAVRDGQAEGCVGEADDRTALAVHFLPSRPAVGRLHALAAN